MNYRTRTYIAGAWTEDQDLIQQLLNWNNSKYWALHFSDAHDLTEARDTSLPCSIKHSLRIRLKASKTFILVVGKETTERRKGSCQYCENYRTFGHSCSRNMNVDFRSFVDFECEMAVHDKMRIVVIYNSRYIDRHKCPASVRFRGQHIAAKIVRGGYVCWDYQTIEAAIMGY